MIGSPAPAEAQRAMPSVAILVDDLVAWLVLGIQPTGIQRVVSELVETAYERPDIEAWAAVVAGDGTGAPLFQEVSRASLRRSAHRGERNARRRSLRLARQVARRVPMPRAMRVAVDRIYKRLAVAVGGFALSGSAAGRAPDLVLVPGAFWVGGYAARVIELAKSGPPVRIVVYDLFPVRNPEWVESGFGREFTLLLDAIAPVADRIVTMSREVADQVAERYPGTRDRIRVGVPAIWAHGPKAPAESTTPGADAASGADGTVAGIGAVPAGSVTPGPFLFVLSTVEPRKNHRVILAGWRLAKADPRLAHAWLVIAGRRGWLADDIEAEIAHDAERLQIMRLDRATDAEIADLYDGCAATIHASWAEGFGLPVRESVARGIPTLVSTTIPLDGLPGDTYTLFDPRDAEGLSALMVRAVVAGHVRAPIPTGEGTGWEPVLSALID